MRTKIWLICRRAIKERLLVSRWSLRMAAHIFVGAAALTLTVALFAYLLAPSYTRAALRAVMEIYQARANWAFRYLAELPAIILNNGAAAFTASGLGVVGALTIAALHRRTGEGSLSSRNFDPFSAFVVQGVIAAARLVLPKLTDLHNFAIRTAVAVAALPPLLSLVCNGGLLGIWLGSAFAEEQLEGMGKAIVSIAPHAVFELPAVCLAAAVGLQIAAWLMEQPAEEPHAFIQRARQCLRSPLLHRTWGGLFLLILIGAVLETRISWGLQEQLFAAVP